MSTIYVIVILGIALLQLIMIIKFFQIASDTSILRELAMRNFEKDVFESDKYLKLVDAVKNMEMPQIKYGNQSNDYCYLSFGDDKQSYAVYRNAGKWYSTDNDGRSVYAKDKNEAIKFCYYFATNK